MVTIKDIAKEAGVSIATVSRYLNDPESVKTESAAKVAQALQSLNYVPNAVARSLKSNHTDNIALVMPKFNEPFFTDIIVGISDVVGKSGYNIIIYDVEHMNKSADEIILALRRNRVAGAIFVGLSFDDLCYEKLEELTENGIPVVYTNRAFIYKGVPLVYPNFKRVGEIAARHLIERGKKRLALIHGFPEGELLQAHWDSFRHVAQEKGLQEPLFLRNERTLHITPQNMAAMRRADVDGVFVLTQMTAAGLIRQYTSMGYSIPDEVAIICMGNTEVTKIPLPALTCIDLEEYSMGYKSAESLIAQIEGRRVEPVTVFEPHVVQRHST